MKIELTPKVAGAVVAVFLGGALALAATITRGPGAGPIDAPSLVQTIIAERDHVTPRELARWIIEKKQDYQLIDIRLPWQFRDYHIPTAVNIPLAELFQPGGINQLSRSKKIVLYGLGAGHAAEAQLLLRLKGYNAYSLREGISAWWDDVMTPASLLSENPSPQGYQQAKQLRQYFLGAGRTTGKIIPTVPLPVPPNASQPAPPQGKFKLKLGKGCS